MSLNTGIDRDRVSIFGASLIPYLIFAMFIVYVGIKPVSELLKLNNMMEIRGADLSMTFMIGIYVFFKLRKMSGTKCSLYRLLGLLALFLIITIQLISYGVVESYRDQSIMEYYNTFYNVVVRFCVFLFILGSNIELVFSVGKNREFKFLAFTVYFAFILMLFITRMKYYMDIGPGTCIFDAFERPSQYYLYYGDIFSFYTLWIICVCKNKIIKAAICINAVYWLYMIGSRTSLYCYCIVLIIMFIRNFIKSRKMALIVISIICLSSYIISQNIDNIINSPLISGDNRMIRAIIASGQDGSYLARQVQLQEGIEDLKQYWLTGRFLMEYERTGEAGDYIHNILSYWVEYGILVFSLVFFLCVSALIRNTSAYIKVHNDSMIDFIFLCSTFVIAASFTSRSYDYPYIWFAISMSARLREIKNIGSQNILNFETNPGSDISYENMYALEKRF